jgi:small subunit ribosomal protein S1
LKVGDDVEAKIINVDRKSRSIQLSVKARETQDEASVIKDLNRKAEEATTTTLGDLLKEQMRNQAQADKE